jgi:hypothetical protein
MSSGPWNGPRPLAVKHIIDGFHKATGLPKADIRVLYYPAAGYVSVQAINDPVPREPPDASNEWKLPDEPHAEIRS